MIFFTFFNVITVFLELESCHKICFVILISKFCCFFSLMNEIHSLLNLFMNNNISISESLMRDLRNEICQSSSWGDVDQKEITKNCIHLINECSITVRWLVFSYEMKLISQRSLIKALQFVFQLISLYAWAFLTFYYTFNFTYRWKFKKQNTFSAKMRVVKKAEVHY